MGRLINAWRENRAWRREINARAVAQEMRDAEIAYLWELYTRPTLYDQDDPERTTW